MASVIIFFSLNTFAENYEVDISKIENSVIKKEKETELKFIEDSNLGDTDYKKFITGEKKFKKKPTNEMTEDELLYLAFVARIKSNVNQILKDLESGKLFQSNADTISEKEKLKTILEQLKANLKRIEQEIIELKNNETFEVINNITNWDNYFTATKEQLKEELHNLTLEIES